MTNDGGLHEIGQLTESVEEILHTLSVSPRDPNDDAEWAERVTSLESRLTEARQEVEEMEMFLA
jgi:hypothetical protein